MVIINRFSYEIYYEGVDMVDCLEARKGIPKDRRDRYVIIPYEEYKTNILPLIFNPIHPN